jgi:hypothetical protein
MRGSARGRSGDSVPLFLRASCSRDNRGTGIFSDGGGAWLAVRVVNGAGIVRMRAFGGEWK